MTQRRYGRMNEKKNSVSLHTKSTQDWKLSICFTRVVGRSLPSGGGLLEVIEFI